MNEVYILLQWTPIGDSFSGKARGIFTSQESALEECNKIRHISTEWGRSEEVFLPKDNFLMHGSSFYEVNGGHFRNPYYEHKSTYEIRKVKLDELFEWTKKINIYQ